MTYMIVFEGPDRGGKSTQAQLLYERLSKEEDREVVLLREPNYWRELIINEEDRITQLLLFMADRRKQIVEVILPKLREGAIIIMDRYKLSSVVYQGYVDGVDISLISEMNILATEDLAPNVWVYLDSDMESLDGELDAIESRGDEYHQRIREAYRSLFDEAKGIVDVLIPERGSIDGMADDIYKGIKERLCKN
jgi:dTMP kinase